MKETESSKDIKKTWELLESVEKNKNIYKEEKEEKRKTFKDVLEESTKLKGRHGPLPGY